MKRVLLMRGLEEGRYSTGWVVGFAQRGLAGTDHTYAVCVGAGSACCAGVADCLLLCCLMLSGVQGWVVGCGGFAHGLPAWWGGVGGLLLLGGLHAVLQRAEACSASAIQHAAG
jgi:hypothetical protein